MKTSSPLRKWLFVSIFAVFAATILSKAQSSNNCTPPPTGLVAWWQAESNGVDSAGGNTAFAPLLPGGASFAPGEVGQAFSLNGTNAYLFVPSSPSLNVGAGPGLTIEGWIKVSSVSGLHPIAEWDGDARGKVGVQLWLNSNPYQSGALFGALVDTNSNVYSLVSTEGVVQPNVFQHVALTYDQASGVGTLYLNGAVVAQSNFGSFVPLTSYNLWIAHRPFDVRGDWTYNATLGGLLDELSIYNRALSSNEIAAIYNAGSAGKCSGSSSGSAPTITQQPTAQTAAAGSTAVFSVTATGTAPLYYQWFGPGNVAIPGAITSTLTLTNVQQANDGAYFVRVTNAFGFAQSSNAVLNVTGGTTNLGLVITKQPTNQTVAIGGTATFTVTALSVSALHFQWYGPTNNVIPGAVASTLTLSNVQPANAGMYFVVVSNALGFARSSNAVLTVTGGSTNDCTPPPSGIVGWWKGDGNTADSAGSNDGSVTGGAISYAAGEVNQAFHYTNGGGYVQIPAAPSLNVGLGSGFTIEGWIQPDDISSQRPVFEWQYNTNNDSNGAHFWISVGAPGCLFANIIDTNNNAHSFSSAPGILTTNYQHIALTYVKSNGVASIYRNGVLVAQASLGSFTPNTTGNVLLGERTYLGGDPQVHYVGNLDELSLYSRALSSNEIAAIFNAGSAGKCSESSGTAPTITHQATNETVAAGGTAVFSVTATGTAPLHYQWYGPASTIILGANSSTLTLTNVQQPNDGSYFVRVTNAFGFAQSSNAVLTVTGGGNTNSCTPPPTGLAAWWPAEDNGSDVVNGNTAFLENGVMFVPGEVGQAFQLLEYTNGFMRVPASPSLNVGAGSGLTLEGWIKVSSSSGLHPIAEWHGDTRDQVGVQLWLDTNPFQSGALFGALTDTNFNQHNLLSADGIVQPGVFQHVALTYDKASGIGTLYLNGTVVAQANFGSFEPLTTYDLWIGHRPFDVPGDWSYGATLGGLLDELSIYNRALSSNEIAAIYSAGSAGKCSQSSGMAPAITHQPTNQTAAIGGTASFTVTATGTAPLHYQWFGPASNGIPGAIASTLTLTNVQQADAGIYFVRVTNGFGFAQSSNAVLTVTDGGGSTNDCTPAPNGIVGWWKGDGNTADSAGSNDGSVTGGSISYAAGEVNQAFSYTEGSGYVQIPAAPSLNVGLGSGFTIEGWIKPADIADQLPLFEWQYNTNNDSIGAHFWISVGTPGCLFANIIDTNNNAHLISSAAGILTTNYQHIALTYVKSNGVASIYRNGVLVAQANLGSFTPNTTGNALLGERTYLGGDPQVHYVGNLDEMSLYGRALSSNEIATIYNAGSGGKCSGSPSGAAPMITHQPTNQTVAAGSAAAFSVTATGTAPLHYQWFGPASNGIPGAIASTLTLTNVQAANAGSYFVLVTNGFGFAQSTSAVLTLSTNTPHTLINSQPAVNMSVVGNTQVLSWPVSAGDYTLQSATSLMPPINWTNVPVTLQTNGDNIEVTLPTGGQQEYFRLYHP